MAAAEPLCGAKHVCTHVGHVLKLSVANMHRVEDPVDISSPSPPGLPKPGMPDPRYYKNGFTPKMTKQPRLDASQLQVAYYSLLPARLSSVQVPTKSILRSEERSPRTLQWWDDNENDAAQGGAHSFRRAEWSVGRGNTQDRCAMRRRRHAGRGGARMVGFGSSLLWPEITEFQALVVEAGQKAPAMQTVAQKLSLVPSTCEEVGGVKCL